jgi:putative DNA methylase
LVAEARKRVRLDFLSRKNDPAAAQQYANDVSVYLAFLVSQLANHSSSICGWNHPNTQMRAVFSRQAIPMVWDFAEANVFSESSGSYSNLFERMVKGFAALPASTTGVAAQADAQTQTISANKVISTDPPYYANIGYADLSDFFYVWLRRSLSPVFPELFGTLVVPKAEELVATPYRHGSREKAENFFLGGMTTAMANLAKQAHPDFPVTIYYAFKQSETGTDGTSNTGWATFLEAVILAGFQITGTWPMRTEKEGRSIGNGTNALASSIVLVCRKRGNSDVNGEKSLSSFLPPHSSTISRREFLRELNAVLPEALAAMTGASGVREVSGERSGVKENGTPLPSPIAPVDLEQAIIGPGMAVFSKYEAVLDNAGKRMTVAEALAEIIKIKDTLLNPDGGADYDRETRWAVKWFASHGFGIGVYGTAEALSNGVNVSVAALVDAGIVESGGGKVRLLRPAELPRDWSPETDAHLTVWEMTHHLVRLWHVENAGEVATAALLSKLGGRASDARSLAYWLFSLAERGGCGADAQGYNALVAGWTVLAEAAARVPAKPRAEQLSLELGV